MKRADRIRVGPAITAALIALVVVIKLGLIILDNPGFSAAELTIVAAVHAASNPFLDAIALTINSAFGPMGATVIVLLGSAGIVLCTRHWQRGLQFAVVSGAAWLSVGLVKVLVQRPRPDPAQLAPMILNDPASFSYPSGHVAFAVAASCAVVLMLRGRARTVGIVVAGVVVLLTGWSRISLGVHYPTDVLASIALVPFVAFAVSRLWERAMLQHAARTGAHRTPVGSSHGR